MIHINIISKYNTNNCLFQQRLHLKQSNTIANFLILANFREIPESTSRK